MSIWPPLFLALVLLNIEVGIRMGALGAVLNAILRRGE